MLGLSGIAQTAIADMPPLAAALPAQAIFNDLSWHAPFALVGLRITGANGAAIRSGNKGYLRAPFDGVIEAAIVTADQAGTLTFDIYKSAAFPPTRANTITGTAKPRLIAAQSSNDRYLLGWITTLHQGDFVGFEVLQNDTIITATLALLVSRN